MKKLIFTIGMLYVLSSYFAYADSPMRGVKPPSNFSELMERISRSYSSGGIARNMVQRYNQMLNQSNVNGTETISNVNIPLLLGRYSNTTDRFTLPSFTQLLFTGPNSTGTMVEYFREVSYNQLEIHGSTYGWYTAPQTQANYAGSDNGLGGGGARFAKDLTQVADATVDFGQFDNDGPDGIPNSGDDDGYVDALMIIHTGGGAEAGDNDNIWSHRWNFSSAGIGEFTTNDAKEGGGFIKINDYIIQPEQSGSGAATDPQVKIGVFCHEFGHILGLPDLYDTKSTATSEGVGTWCLMGAGSWGGDNNHAEKPAHMSAWCKEKLGWVIPVIVTHDLLNQQIKDVEQNKEFYKIWKDGNPSQEYYLVENRQKTGFDQYLYDSGLLIWHIDNTKTSNRDENHKLVDVEEADGKNDLDNQVNRGDAGDIYPGTTNNKTFDINSNPNSRDYSSTDTKVSVLNVTKSSNLISADLKIEIITSSNQFRVYNDGNSVLNVTSISSSVAWLSTTPNNFNVQPGSNQPVTINIDWNGTPNPSGSGIITVNSNDPVHPAVSANVTAIKSAQSVTTPIITPNSGAFPPAVSVSISCATSGATIRYTLDGIDPTTSSTQYSSAVSINSTSNVTLKAKAWKDGYTPSNIATGNYSYNPGVSVPLIPLCNDEVMKGSEFWLDVQIGNTSQSVSNLKIVSFELKYNNTAIIDYVSDELGNFLVSAQKNVIPDDQNGKISASIYRLSGSNSGYGTVLRIKFSVSNSAIQGQTIVFNFENILANDENGNTIQIVPQTKTVTINDCLKVWPGDANNNNSVEITDINYVVAINWGKTGIIRQGASMAWQAQCASPWYPILATYADCNGNGLVEITDINSIIVNFSRTHLGNQIQNPKYVLDNPPLLISGPSPVSPGTEIWFDVNVGSSTNPVSDVKVISFELLYSPAFIQYLSNEPGEFITGANQMVIPDSANGKLSVSVYRLSGGNSGNGTVIRLKFKVAENTPTNSELGFNFNNVLASRTDGSEQTLTPQGFNLVVPVELTSFIATIIEDGVNLTWLTATETNNRGFSIERKSAKESWMSIGFVEGNGTKTEAQTYHFTDCKFSNSGKYYYRLKQIDYDGTFTYSSEITVEVNFIPSDFSLFQNFPNPFNPSTKINYQIPIDTKVTIKLFDVIGNEVITLVDENKSAGSYEVNLDAANLQSGIYFYRLHAGKFTAAKKLILLK